MTPTVTSTEPVAEVLTRRRVLAFGLLTAVMASGYGVMFTVLDDFRDLYGIAEGSLGLIVGIGFGSSFLAQVFLAPVADRGHARKLVIAGILVNLVGLLILGFGTRLWVLLLGRVISGLGLGMAFPAIRRIVILGDQKRLGDNLGLLLACDVAGFAAGPALSAVLVGPLGLAAPFLVIAGASAACLPLVFRIRVDESVVAHATETRFAFDLLRLRPYLAAVCMGAALFMMIGTFDALWAVVLDDLGAGEWLANVGVTVFALPLIIFGEFGGRLAQRVGPFKLGPLGLGLGALYMSLYGFMPGAWAMLAVATVHAVSDGLTVSSTAVAVGMVTPDDRHAGAQGLLGGVQTLTAGAVAVVAGVLYQYHGRVVAYLACGVAMSVLVGISLVLTGPQWRNRRGGDALLDPASAVTGHA
ncbi:MAG: MFS transporter [Ilumatobacteraceae bacterium]